MAESVTARQRDADVGRANTVHLVIRNDELDWFSYQKKVRPTNLCKEVAEAAYELFCEHYPIGSPVRLLGISVSSFDYNVRQMTLDALDAEKDYDKQEKVESAVASLRKKYGYAALQRGVVMQDDQSKGLDLRKKQQPAVKEEQVISNKNQREKK